MSDQVSYCSCRLLFFTGLLNLYITICRGHLIGVRPGAKPAGIQLCKKLPVAKRQQLLRAYREEEKESGVAEAKKAHNNLPPNHTINDLVEAAAVLEAAQGAQEVQVVKTVRSQGGSSNPQATKQTTISGHYFTAEKAECDLLVSCFRFVCYLLN